MADAVQLSGTFSKLDPERRLAFGWAYVSERDGKVVTDISGDFVDKAALSELEDAAYEYVLASREADEMHERFEGVAKMVESMMFTPEKLNAMGLPETVTGWWVGFRVEDEDVWQKVKSGEYAAFSIRGTGVREAVEA